MMNLCSRGKINSKRLDTKTANQGASIRCVETVLEKAAARREHCFVMVVKWLSLYNGAKCMSISS